MDTMSKKMVGGYPPRERIDWDWVKEQVFAKERIRPDGNRRTESSILNAVEDCLRIARHMAKPKMISARKSIISGRDGRLALEGPLPIAGSVLSSHIPGATAAYLFCGTIGSEIEETSTMLMESGEPLHGYLIDRIGSFAVESLAENFEDGLRKACGKAGMGVSMRYSPGYCDWPIEEQKGLEKALDFSKAGVRLTESCMMIPKKSVSGLIGVGPRRLFSEKRSQCSVCTIKECGYRRV